MAIPLPSPLATATFRCLDDGHLINEPRSERGPLVARQSGWCSTHGCAAVRVDPPRSAATGDFLDDD